jgi:hypothetical protein
MHGTVARIDIGRSAGYNRVHQSERKSAGKNSSIVLRAKSIRLLTFSELFKAKKLNVSPEAQQKNANEINVLSEAEQRNAEQMHFDRGELLEKAGILLKLEINENTEPLKKQAGISKDKIFYVGIIAGTQFSQTKQQGFGNAGLSAGLLAGIHLNTRLAIESGFNLSSKYYASAGEYFDMSKISASMPSGMKLIRVQSKINVVEIPINLKYDVFKGKKGNVFVSGGISSYILTNEKNQYQASLNGNNEIMTGNYPEHQNYFAAAMNASAGYEYKPGKNVNLRIEPYFQIPMKTIGMGSMHVVSAGVYLGITIPVIK